MEDTNIQWERDQFVSFLTDTLIPDLREAGRHATAEDFETAVAFINNPNLERHTVTYESY